MKASQTDVKVCGNTYDIVFVHGFDVYVHALAAPWSIKNIIIKDLGKSGLFGRYVELIVEVPGKSDALRIEWATRFFTAINKKYQQITNTKYIETV